MRHKRQHLIIVVLVVEKLNSSSVMLVNNRLSIDATFTPTEELYVYGSIKKERKKKKKTVWIDDGRVSISRV